MLIKTTLSCKMLCSHCLEDATPSGEHMSLDLFKKALDFTERAECEVLRAGLPIIVLLSGGECTDNPLLPEFVELVVKRKWFPMILTHGLWLDNEKLRNELLRDGWNVLIQVTNDSRFYPRKPPVFKHDRVTYVDKLLVLSTIGRAARKEFNPKGLEARFGPSSFNLRSMTRSLGAIELAIQMLRARNLSGKSGACIPAVTHEGVVTAGESRLCWPIGTVESSNKELTEALLSMGSCNRCGQEANLPLQHRRAIGAE